ncbi:MAG: hypothetical protein WCL06_01535 [Bacteroidota bacterium]
MKILHCRTIQLCRNPEYQNIDFTFTIDAQQTLNLEFLMEKL